MTSATATATAIQFRNIQLRTGVRLHYAEVGPPAGRPILLLHGYSDSWFSFSRILSELPPDLRLIIPSQRGHGDSDRPMEGYTFERFALDAMALLDAIGVPAATVVGHSMGSFAAQRMAVLAPKQVSRAVLIGSAGTVSNEAVLELVPIVQALTDPVDPVFVRTFQMSAIFRPVPEEFIDRAVAESLKLPARVWKAVLAGMLELPVATQSGGIRCPTSIVWGDRDAFFGRRDQEELLRLIPGAKLHVLTDVGHTPQWEVPEEFARLLAAILD
jgi:pimeloyl-ACP methyl ester carboxylesterase